MGQNNHIKSMGFALLATSILSTSALAGGFDRGGVNIDQLFDTDRFAATASVTHVIPRRTIKNIQRESNVALAPAIQVGVAAQVGPLIGSADPAVIGAFVANPANAAIVGPIVSAVTIAVAGNPAFAPATGGPIDVDSTYTAPRLGAKMNVAEGFDCLATYSEPFGGDSGFGTNNAYSATAVQFSIDTQDYGLTCAFQFGAGTTSVGDAFARVIVGGSYQELQGFQSRQSFLDFANAGIGAVGGVTNTSGLGTFNVEGDAVGYRVGVAYEIPDIALRAMVLYNSKYDYDLSGIQNNTGFGAVIPGTQLVPITLQTEIPQSLEVKLQSGIAEGTLAFANFKWQDWSKLGVININGGLSPATGGPSALSFDPLYQDGYTVTAGIGKVINENVSALASLTWDRGTSTISGTQTDSWLFSTGLRYTQDEHLEVNLGGAIGILEGGTSSPTGIGDQANQITYEFDADFVYALSGGLKVKF